MAIRHHIRSKYKNVPRTRRGTTFARSRTYAHTHRCNSIQHMEQTTSHSKPCSSFLQEEISESRFAFRTTFGTNIQQDGKLSHRLAQKQHPPSTKLLIQLHLFEHNTILKSKGRIVNAELLQDTGTPIFLPRKSQITSLYILHVHQENNLCGASQTLCELRRKSGYSREESL